MGGKKRKNIVALCGSACFEDTFCSIQESLTRAGYIVLTPGVFDQGDNDGKFSADKTIILSNLQKQKIDLAGWIYVDNPELYFGLDTWSEISYAWMTNKGIAFLEGSNDIGAILPRIMDERLFQARECARRNLINAKNSNMVADKDVSFPHFLFHGMKIYDPWITPEANFRETMLGQTCLVDDLVMIEDPFSFYGKKRTAYFLEELLSLLHGKDLEEAQNLIEVIRNKVIS